MKHEETVVVILILDKVMSKQGLPCDIKMDISKLLKFANSSDRYENLKCVCI